MLNPENVREWLTPYAEKMSEEQTILLAEYVEILMRWTERMPLTSLNEPREIVEVLIGESLAAIPLLGRDTGWLADVGSGAGFPGMPLKILVPAIEVDLIEPNVKKAVFLEEVARRLKLQGLRVIRARIEDLEAKAGTYDWVASRGLAERHNIMKYAKAVLKGGGELILWISEDELAALQSKAGWRWNAVRLMGTRKRFIAKGIPS